jgi:putative DNA primase/helicase
MLDEGDALINEGTLTANPLMVESGDRLKSWAVRSQNSIFDDSIKRAERQSAVPVEQFDLGKHLLNCKNGTVDLRTSTLRPHDRGDFITHRLDYAFDPEATAPRWMAFLDEVFPGQPETVEWLQRVAGYAATGEVIEHCLVLCVGKGRNGKSVFWNAIANVLGSLVGHVGFATFEKKGPGSSTADLASLRGKRLAIVQEGEASTTLAESTIKRSTGGDEIACRNLYRSQMSFLPEFLISMSTNSAPRIRGADEGIWSRIRKVDFCRYFTEDERDPWLNQTLAGEAEGILRWIVDGARLWYEQGLSDPTAIKAATLDYRSTSDELAGFVGAVVVADADGSILGSDVMALYLDHCVEENVKPWSRRALYDALVERVETVKKVKRMDGIHLLGIRLASKNDGVG